MPYTMQQTDVAERRNRTLKDMVRSMWRRDLLRDALLIAAYLLNQVSSKSVELDPYDLLDQERAQSGATPTLGVCNYVHFTSHPHGKLGPRAKKCIFLRYPKGSKGYVFLGENEDGTRTEIESRNANFVKNEFPGIGETSKE